AERGLSRGKGEGRDPPGARRTRLSHAAVGHDAKLDEVEAAGDPHHDDVAVDARLEGGDVVLRVRRRIADVLEAVAIAGPLRGEGVDAEADADGDEGDPDAPDPPDPRRRAA